jgi:hypothetical protein
MSTQMTSKMVTRAHGAMARAVSPKKSCRTFAKQKGKGLCHEVESTRYYKKQKGKDKEAAGDDNEEYEEDKGSFMILASFRWQEKEKHIDHVVNAIVHVVPHIPMWLEQDVT